MIKFNIHCSLFQSPSLWNLLKLLYSTVQIIILVQIIIHTEPFHTVGHCERRNKDWYYMMSEFISKSSMKVNKSFQENISTMQKKSKRRSVARILLTPAICERLCVKRNDVTCCIHRLRRIVDLSYVRFHVFRETSNIFDLSSYKTSITTLSFLLFCSLFRKSFIL